MIKDLHRIIWENSYYSSNVIKNYSDIYIAFFSIIENAIKYSIYGETINFDLVDYDKETHVKISNRCESLKVTDINRLTEKGFRGENGKGSIQSSGLGLHLVKEIFEKGEVDFNIKCD